MKKSDDGDNVKVNRRKSDKVNFESNFIQQIADGIDFLKDESKEILKEIDSAEFKQKIDEFDLDQFSDDALNQIDDIYDDISKFKSEVISADDFPDDVKEQYRNTQQYLNRDDDYVRRAKRKLIRLNSDEGMNWYRANNRIVELCDKAVAVNDRNYDAYSLKGQALINLEKYPEAIDEFINALSIRDDAETWLAIANANRLNEDYGDAINVYDSILAKNEMSADALKGKAHVYFDIDDYASCDEMFKKANSIEYLDEDSFRIWSECLEHLKNN